MADTISPETRSRNMARIRGKDTKPEMLVRRALHQMGYRYRLHIHRLPGSPDIVFPTRQKVIFVHGCFWHWHSDRSCKIARLPKSRVEYWRTKLMRNRKRDRQTTASLKRLGWSVLTVWECETRELNQ